LGRGCRLDRRLGGVVAAVAVRRKKSFDLSLFPLTFLTNHHGETGFEKVVHDAKEEEEEGDDDFGVLILMQKKVMDQSESSREMSIMTQRPIGQRHRCRLDARQE